MITALLTLLPLLVQDEPSPEWSLGPTEPIFESFIADPRRPTFSLTLAQFTGASIDGAGNSRYGIRMGSRFGLFGLGELGGGPIGIDAMVGFHGQFDADNSSDNIGWDGIFGFDVAWRPRDDLSLRLGVAHDSAHVGDEVIEKTGRTRIGYTREEVRLGVSLDLDARWRTYTDFGWAYQLRNEDLMEAGRWQGGLEFDLGQLEHSGKFRPYAALDLSAYEEDDWEVNTAFQIGYARRAAGRGIWRIGFEVLEGRSPLGEFFQDREAYFGLGVWIDP